MPTRSPLPIRRLIPRKAQNSETRRDRIYGCWTSTGRRFTLFLQRDFGLDLIERADIEIVDGRYIGVIRTFEGGVSESRTAATWDAQKHAAVRNSKPCDEVSSGDFSGVEKEQTSTVGLDFESYNDKYISFATPSFAYTINLDFTPGSRCKFY